MNDGPVLLEAEGLTKSFGGVRALDGVDLTVLSGEVHGLLGENGSGKSTLIKILAGYHVPDAGTLAVNGRSIRLPLRPGECRRLGFEFVHQDLGLVPSLSVAENLFLPDIADPANPFFYSWRAASREAKRIFKTYGLTIDPAAIIERIKPVERAMVAIVRALEGLRATDRDGQGLLVLDEPTPFLPRQEVAMLFDLIRTVASRGTGVLFVSHDLDEAISITDRITVLRDGRAVHTVDTASTSNDDLIRLIIGHDLVRVPAVDAQIEERRAVVLGARHLTTRWLSDVSFDLHEGEVLGLTGLVGSGFDDVVYALFGALPDETGSIVLDGVERPVADMTPTRAMALGFALVPGDRIGKGSIASLSVADNVNLPVLDRFFRHLNLRRRDLDRNARELMTRFDVRPVRPEMDYGALSGGNQQKAMMAKWQQTDPRVFLLHEPTQGVDVGARQQIFGLIRGWRDRTATICASSDYEQLAAVCDRVGVMAHGRLIGFLGQSELTKERIADSCLRSTISNAVA